MKKPVIFWHIHVQILMRSLFINASPQEFFVESPGGFPHGITPDNILEKTFWRNRCIAEVLEKAELVERAGQGMNDIFESTIREGKGTPNFLGSDAYSVVLRIPAQVKDKNFILFLEKAARDKQILLSFEEVYELEKIREKGITNDSEFRDKFINLALIEQVGRTRGAKYILSQQYYDYIGKPGMHTRLAGLSREEKKALILKHLKNKKKGVFSEFSDAFSGLKRNGISNLLSELKKEGKIRHQGSRRSGYWEINDENT